MAINLKNLSQKTEELVSSVFKNKTSGAEKIIDAWTFLRRYTLEELKGQFTKKELLGLIDLLNGTIFEPRFSSHSQFLIAEIEDGEKFQNQSKRFGYDYSKLLEKVCKLTAAQTYFLIEEIQRFWEKESSNIGALEKFITNTIN